MFSRSLSIIPVQRGHSRNMATLRDISNRLKAVKNIEKITKSMKMVSAAKYAKAEKDLKPARAYGLGQKVFYEQADVQLEPEAPNQLIIAMTSDRGLCGGTHSSIAKAIRSDLPAKPDGVNSKIVAVGDKARGILSRLFPKNMLMHFYNIGKKPPTFRDATVVANTLQQTDYQFDFAQLYYNTFKSVVAYKLTIDNIPSLDRVAKTEKISLYDSIDEDVLKCYNEFASVSLIYYAMKEGACTEQSQRMSAMDGASKNAGEMIEKLTLTFNRTRQAAITRELSEITSGAAAI